MSKRSYPGTSKTSENQRGDVWLHARRFMVVAVVAAMVSGSMLVKVRAAAAGDLDPTFSADGRVRTVFGLRDEFANGIAIQTDGKIVVVGEVSMNSFDFGVARYNTDGTLDPTFSGDGRQTTNFTGSDDRAQDVAIQPDGKIVVVGSTESSSFDVSFALARYNSDGTLDTTFSGDGKQVTDFAGTLAVAFSVAIQPNGKIVVGGSTFGEDFVVARYNTNGTLDNTFSGDGIEMTDFSGGNDVAFDMAIQPNGKIVLAGFSNSDPMHFDFALARYNLNGTLDTTFSDDGKVVTPVGSNAAAFGVAIQSNGRIVAAGYTEGGSGGGDFMLTRYNGNGSLDDGTVNDRTPGDMFGTGGIVTTDFFGAFDQAQDVAIQSGDKIVAVGLASHNNLPRTNDFALARYNNDGSLDMTFGGDGRQTTDFGGNSDQAEAIAIQTDGKIVVAGFVGKSNDDFDFAVARYLGD